MIIIVLYSIKRRTHMQYVRVCITIIIIIFYYNSLLVSNYLLNDLEMITGFALYIFILSFVFCLAFEYLGFWTFAFWSFQVIVFASFWHVIIWPKVLNILIQKHTKRHTYRHNTYTHHCHANQCVSTTWSLFITIAVFFSHALW